jgi:hypothetical protein
MFEMMRNSPVFPRRMPSVGDDRLSKPCEDAGKVNYSS